MKLRRQMFRSGTAVLCYLLAQPFFLNEKGVGYKHTWDIQINPGRNGFPWRLLTRSKPRCRYRQAELPTLTAAKSAARGLWALAPDGITRDLEGRLGADRKARALFAATLGGDRLALGVLSDLLSEAGQELPAVVQLVRGTPQRLPYIVAVEQQLTALGIFPTKGNAGRGAPATPPGASRA
jgi:hypothetical protein